MNQYTIVVNPSEINFRPASIIEEIFQNVVTIVSTMLYSVPLFRAFGVQASYLDEPTPLAKAQYIGEIIEKVEHFEKRVIVEEVKFDKETVDGKLVPIVIISIRDGVKL